MITIKNDIELQHMREAGRVVADTLNKLEEHAKPGISTGELDKIAEEFIKSRNAIPSFKGYCGFPASICASVNNEVVHGIPSKDVILKDGDIISIDCGAILNGYQGDAARTFPIGNVSDEARKLIEVTKNSFFKGIEKAKIGNRLTDISSAIQQYAEESGYSVVRDYVGHGIGKEMHEDPEVPNFGRPGRGPKLEKGMALAIEPMINIGDYYVKVQPNNWTVVTKDGTLSAHYENTILIVDDGPEITTLI